MRNLITFTLVALTAFSSRAQTAELLQHYTISDVIAVANQFGLPVDIVAPEYEVNLYRVSYDTTHPNGETWPVTGALAVPVGIDCPLPLNCYAHGTIARKTDAPSYQSTESLLGILYGSVGFVTALPDYIGLGDSPGLHPYVHAESEAQASLDMLRATRDLRDELGFDLNDQLFLWGYSQGGHTAMALHRMIETDHSDEFTVTACAPMSGPYDISGVQAEVITGDQPYPTPGYLPYVVLSYQLVYGNLYESLDEVFLPQYAAIIPDLFDGTNTMGFINNQFPSVPSQMLLPEVIEEYENDPEHPIRLALQDNDVYDWAPEAPVRLYYCNGDDQVTYLNSIIAEEAMTANGAADVLAFDGGDLDHGGCAPLAMFAGFNYFNALKEVSFNQTVSIDVVNASGQGANNGAISIEIDGDPGSTWALADGSTPDALPPGQYEVVVTNANGCSRTFTVEVGVGVSVTEALAAKLQVYPNPAQEQLFLKGNGFKHVALYGLNGRMIWERNAEGLRSIAVADLPAGVYTLIFDGWHARKVAISR